MSDFDKAIIFTLKQEGGYVNDQKDPGGETKYGISKKQYPFLDISALTLEQVKNIYHTDYWMPAKCEQISYPLNMVHFDCAVNSGIPRAIIILQRTVGVDDDGILGPITLAAINKQDADVLAILAIAEREHFYRVLVQEKPQLLKFLHIWLNRCDALKVAIHG